MTHFKRGAAGIGLSLALIAGVAPAAHATINPNNFIRTCYFGWCGSYIQQNPPLNSKYPTNCYNRNFFTGQITLASTKKAGQGAC